MDIGEGTVWPVIWADRLDQVLDTWHHHRFTTIAVICLCAILLAYVRLRYSYRNPNRGFLAVEDDVKTLREPRICETFDFKATAMVAEEAKKLISRQNSNRKSKPAATKTVTGRKPGTPKSNKPEEEKSDIEVVQPLIFFSSLTGTTERLAKDVCASLDHLSTGFQSIHSPQVQDLSYIDLDEYFTSGPKSSYSTTPTRFFYILLIPSYDIDTIINTFLAHLEETHHDFRIDTSPLSSLAGYTVFGVGDKQGWPTEEKGFCSQAIEVDKWMAKLSGRKRAYPLGLGDVSQHLDTTLRDWLNGVCSSLHDVCNIGTLGDGITGSGDAFESDYEEDVPETEFPDSGRHKRRKMMREVDLEDVGRSRKTPNAPPAIDFTTYTESPTSTTVLKQMVPKESPTHTALTKQGYTIVGSHSGVKICRWTKSALRGRGSCYKNSFYGIASHLCMETTPSLSCSNKCVFCWRHGTNPVSTTWRWQVDDPKMIFDGAKEGHYKKIKMMRGVPGVRSERFEEAMRIRHCALSLVGEPIFYPRINEFVGLLHDENISSFLVCNAQHPQQLRDLRRVTQLYVSIDASNRESLRKIDRPLHRDFWERLQECLDILKEKRFVQRTVFRLTLVKGFNIEDEAEGYATLVQRGLPCFVEVKGVTYCGTTASAGAGLTMQNVPFYEEVVQFVEVLNEALAKRGLDYGIAAEHSHSCCILLASKRFLIDGKWNTIIDYDNFFKLLESGNDFGPEDYCKETPEWALWGNGGFDPRDVRVDRKGRPKQPNTAVVNRVGLAISPSIALAF